MGCCRAEVAGAPEPYRRNCDLLGGLDGLHAMTWTPVMAGLTVTLETTPASAGGPGCGGAHSQCQRVHVLVDTPAFGRPTRRRWRKRTWSCREPAYAVGTFNEHASSWLVHGRC